MAIDEHKMINRQHNPPGCGYGAHGIAFGVGFKIGTTASNAYAGVVVSGTWDVPWRECNAYWSFSKCRYPRPCRKGRISHTIQKISDLRNTSYYRNDYFINCLCLVKILCP